MADIDQLNFKVILNDDAFKATVDRDIQMAENLNSKLSEVFKIHSQAKPKQIIADKGVTNAQQMLESIREMDQKISSMSGKKLLVGNVDALNDTLKQVLANLDKIVAKEQEHKTAVQGTNSALLNTRSVLSTLTQLTGVVFGVAGLRNFLSTLMEVTGQFEVQKMALRTILQDIDGADKIFQDLYRFSSDSTYRFSELAKYAKQLASFSIGKNDLLETTKMLGDVASGVGASMDRVIIAYGHVKTSGFLRGIQLRSFSQNGIPILEELAKILTEVEGKAISLGDVFDKMTKREIPFEMVEQAFKNMTSEGGKFYKMQEVLSKTLAGQMNILKGRWENLLYAIGNANDGILKGAVGKVSNLIADYDAVGKKIKEMIVLFGVFQATLGATALAMGTLGEAGTGLLGAFVRLGKQVIANPYVALAATITAAAYAIYELRTQMTGAEKVMATIDNTMAQFNKQLGAETAAYDALYNKLKLAKEGTEEYDNAKKAIMARYGDYITQLKNEGTEVSDLIGIYDALKLKIEAANKARFRDTATTNLERTYNQQIDDFYEHLFNAPLITSDSNYKLKSLVSAAFGKNAGTITGKAEDYFTGLQKEAIWQLVTGGITEEELRKKSEKYEELSPILAAIPTINEIKTEFDGITDAYADGMAKFNDLFKEEGGGDDDNNTKKPLEGWRKSVRDTLYKLDQSFERQFMPGEEDYFEYLDKIGKRYKEVSEQKEKALEEDKHIYQQELDAIKAIDAVLEGNILKDVRYLRTPWKGGSSGGKNPYSDAISDIKTQVSILEKYKSAYDKLEPIFGDQTTSKLASIFGGTADDYKDIDGAIEKLLSSLRRMGDEGKEAADVIETRLGTDAVSKLIKAQTELEKQQKKLEKYQETYRKWASEDFNLGGTGFEYDINKVMSDLNTKLGQVDEKYLQAVKQAQEAHEGNTEAIAAEIVKLGELRDAEKEYVRAQAQNNLDKLAESYLKDQYLLRGVNMDHLGDMSLKQLRNLRGELEAISKDALKMLNDMSGIEGFLGSLGLDVENLTDEAIESLNDKLPESVIEMVKLWKATKDTGLSFDTLNEKIQSAITKGLRNLDEQEKKSIAKLGKYAAKQVLELADAFRELGEASGNAGLTSAAGTISEIADVAKSAMEGFSQGGWIGAAIGGIVSVAKKFIEADVEAEKFKNTVIEIREEIRNTSAINSLSFDSIFGENGLYELRKAKKLLEDAENSVYNILLKPRMERGRLLPNSLQDAMKRAGFDLYDDKGLINKESLEGMQKLYPDDKRWQELIDRVDEYNEALKTVNEVSESIVGGVVSSIADKLVDSWWEAGEAALDYTDILGDVAKAYAKLIVQDLLFEAAFDEDRQEAFKEALRGGDTAKAMSIVEGAMQSAVDMLPTINDALQVLEPYRNMVSETIDSNSVGSGIKSITEDTANLLASYINAIRDDVSSIRKIQETGWENVNLLGASIPTLNEHLAQIAATNFDIAQSNQSILSELQSVIGAPGTSGMVVRVETL